jgi:hypothetical protein
MKSALILAVVCGALTGCAAVDPNACGGSLGTPVLSLSPVTAAAVSNATSPGNQVQFHAGFSYPNSTLHGECVVSNVVAAVFPAWTNPDPLDISISSANDITNGTAICKAPTKGPVTLTATTGTGSSQLSSTVQLTCQ